MASRALAVIVLAAGMGTRMKSALPKVMHPLAGRPMIRHLMDTVHSLSPDRVVVVVGPDMDSVGAAVAPVPTVVQTQRLGTGHAVAQARAAVGEDFDGDVLVLYGDTPLISADTLLRLLAERRGPRDPAVVVLGFKPDMPGEYGRLVVGAEGLKAIVEYRDATREQRENPLCNSGVMAFDGRRMWSLIDRIDSTTNSKGEYYLTDAVALARADGCCCSYVEGEQIELLGVNSRAEQAKAEAVIQGKLRDKAMEGGATLIDPDSVWFSWDTKIGQDVVVWPHVVFGSGVTVGNRVEIRGFCHFEGCSIADGATVGPYARLRPGAEIGASAHIGNFVEIKASTVETGAKVNHLTYIGDARVGAGANVGAGTITCNYDGFSKSFTDIGAGAFIGSNSALVAPVKIGDGAIVGAGSVVTREVAPGALAVARGVQADIPGWADNFRNQQRSKKG